MKTQDRSELFSRPERTSVGARFLLRSAPLFLALLVWAVPSMAALRPGMESLPMDARYAVSAAIGHDQPDYHARLDGTALQADNAGHGLTARFGSGGVEIGSAGQHIVLQPVAWGQGDELMFLPEAVPQSYGNIVASSRGFVSEWYINGPLGLQQGFTVAQPPQACSGVLRIAMAIDGALAGRVEEDGRGVLLTRADGTALYRYSGLLVRDVNGQEAPAWLEARGGMLHICADDRGLNYPVYIDPVIQQAKLTASEGAAYDCFGYSVAMRGDTVVIGAYSANADLGAAYVFTKPESGWAAAASYAARLTTSEGAAGDGFGISVAVSGDTVVVGAPYDDISAKANQGSAYVFTKPASGWATTSSYVVKLIAATGAADDCFGYSVAVSGDTIVVGAYGYQSAEGAIYVFEKPSGGWAGTVVGERLVSPYGNAGDRFGTAVAISGDTLVAGASRDTSMPISASGLAYVFEKPLDGWYAATGKQLSSSDRAENDYFGVSVAVDGDIVVVGADQATIGAKAKQGSAYVFVRPSSGWDHATENAKLIASDGAANDRLGSSVAVNGDAVVVGAHYAAISGQARGAAYVFMKPAAGWSGNPSETAKLTAADGQLEDYFGKTVALSADSVVVGAYKADISAQEDQGAAYIFTVVADEPAQQASAVTFTGVSSAAMTVGWTPASGAGSLVLIREGSAVSAEPVDGTAYTANAAFGSGSEPGADTFAVYSGTGSSVSVTGLAPGATYHVAVYAFKSSQSEAPNYLTANPATGSQSTNTAPLARSDVYALRKNKALTIAAPGVLDNDTAADSDNLTAAVVTEPAHGELTLQADGSFTYIPDKGFKGADSFTYTATDGASVSAPATVTILVGKTCPLAKMYGEDSAEIKQLYRFRDEVLATTAAGRMAIRLYYGLVPVFDGMMEDNGCIQRKAKAFVDFLLPMIETR
ncbi:MAG: cadherin-like domain-containing protein [Deltaproteobacteria bacterium]|nr:cadherin-like domain-containing protein [Deltaproteobacteria bacterium]